MGRRATRPRREHEGEQFVLVHTLEVEDGDFATALVDDLPVAQEWWNIDRFRYPIWIPHSYTKGKHKWEFWIKDSTYVSWHLPYMEQRCRKLVELIEERYEFERSSEER